MSDYSVRKTMILKTLPADFRPTYGQRVRDLPLPEADLDKLAKSIPRDWYVNTGLWLEMGEATGWMLTFSKGQFYG